MDQTLPRMGEVYKSRKYGFLNNFLKVLLAHN